MVGAAGGTGASTLALALATAAGGRVVECASVTASGLAGAPTAELGRHDSGWLQGTRDTVLIERPAHVLTTAANVPVPTNPPTLPPLTVVDVAWELGQVLATPSLARGPAARLPNGGGGRDGNHPRSAPPRGGPDHARSLPVRQRRRGSGTRSHAGRAGPGRRFAAPARTPQR